MNVLTVLLALLFSGIEPQTLQTPDPNRVEEVRVTGNRKMSSDTIRYNLQTKVGAQFNEHVIASDLRRLYNLNYFDDAKAMVEDGKTGKIVIFEVKEKPTMRIIEYVGNNSITKSEILEKLREKKAGI